MTDDAAPPPPAAPADEGEVERLEGLMRRRAFGELAEEARAALQAPSPRRPLRVHALAIGLLGQVVDSTADPVPPALRPLLGDAIGLLEKLIHAPPEARAEADAIGDVARDLATAWQFARARRWPVLVAASADPAPEGRQLLAESERLLRQGLVGEAEALLGRARFQFEVSGPEARPFERAATHLLRLMRSSLGDKVGAAVATSDAGREQARDDARLAYSAEELGTYLAVLQNFHSAARQCLRLELAESCLAVGLDAYRAQAASTGDAERLASALAAIGELAMETERLAAAVLAFDELRRLCRDSPSARPFERRAAAGLGRAWAALGEPRMAQRVLRATLADASPDRGQALPKSHWLGFYGWALDAGDTDAAIAVHELLTAAGDAQGTSRQEIEARGAEASSPAAATDAYRRLLDGALVSSTFRRVAPRLARLLMAQGRLDEAGSLLDSAMNTFDQTARHETDARAELLELAAALDLAQGQADRALDRLFSATAIDSRIAPQRLGCALAGARAGLLRGARRRAEALLGLVVDHFGSDAPKVGAAHAIALRRKGLDAGIEWEKARRVARASSSDAAVDRLRQRLETLRAGLAATALEFARGDGRAVPAPADLSEQDEVERELTCRIGGVAIAGLIEPANPASIAMTLPEHSAFVDIYRYTPLAGPGGERPAARYCAFVIQARMLVWKVVDLGNAEKIDRQVRRWRLGLTGNRSGDLSFATVQDRHIGPRQPAAVMPTGRLSPAARLRRRVLGRLQPALDGHQRLIVSMDGPLCAVPLECLPAESGGDVIDQLTLSYASSARSLTYFGSEVLYDGSPAPGGGPSPPLVLGDPAYGPADGSLAFNDLPGSRLEAREVAALVGAPGLLDASATKAAVLAARSPLVLHLATHGYVLGAAEAPPALRSRPLLRVGLALAGVNRAEGASTGLLTGEEVLSMDLGRTALTVLSACETGLGEPEQGEGLASLGRAFEIAGARAVIVGLWRVPDEATRLLMAGLYRRLRAGQGCAEALHAAKFELRRTHPRTTDWGAFICLGGWGSIAFAPGQAAG